MDTKICTNPNCTHNGEPQSIINFYKQRSQKSGLTPRCKDCIKSYVSAYSKTDRGKEIHKLATQKFNTSDHRRKYAREWARAHYVPREPKPRKPRKPYFRKMRPIADRFWEKVEKSDGCWNWTAWCDHKGYGEISSNTRPAKRLRAHRVSWELHYGPIPPGMCVLHHCDNPKCVRPDHLFLGTQWDNTQDMLAKGRDRHGEGGGWATRRLRQK